MSTAQHLATIDLLCSREFSAEHSRSGAVAGGPGYYIAELLTSEEFWEDDGSRWEAVAEQYEAERDGLSALLTGRWGAPGVFSLASVFSRMLTDWDEVTGEEIPAEEIPEPWSSLSSAAPDVHLWRAAGRWVALAVAQWDKELPFQLLAVVTETDPP
ncbi:hypothetical protein ACFWY6_20350 [Streptomyces sp. NPDC059037]|uniref:hypothetical protein n=1 Tax=Streptomyces sp. NPDC059037 TaxID=3346710 RepID=UPI0036B5E064